MNLPGYANFYKGPTTISRNADLRNPAISCTAIIIALSTGPRGRTLRLFSTTGCDSMYSPDRGGGGVHFTPQTWIRASRGPARSEESRAAAVFPARRGASSAFPSVFSLLFPAFCRLGNRRLRRQTRRRFSKTRGEANRRTKMRIARESEARTSADRNKLAAQGTRLPKAIAIGKRLGNAFAGKPNEQIAKRANRKRKRERERERERERLKHACAVRTRDSTRTIERWPMSSKKLLDNSDQNQLGKHSSS